jgi:hypothetical protein
MVEGLREAHQGVVLLDGEQVRTFRLPMQPNALTGRVCRPCSSSAPPRTRRRRTARALHWAAHHNDFAAVNANQAIEADRKPTGRAPDNGTSALHLAAYKSLPRVVGLLSDRGARIVVWNQKNRAGLTPLLIAEGYRPGNFKPSFETIAAVHKAMLAAGVTPPPPTSRPFRVRRATRLTRQASISLSRNDAVETRERDRLGRSRRRPAHGSDQTNEPPNGEAWSSAEVSGRRPGTAGETPALPERTASLRLGPRRERPREQG